MYRVISILAANKTTTTTPPTTPKNTHSSNRPGQNRRFGTGLDMHSAPLMTTLTVPGMRPRGVHGSVYTVVVAYIFNKNKNCVTDSSSNTSLGDEIYAGIVLIGPRSPYWGQ
jgi:hypothetical protein